MSSLFTESQGQESQEEREASDPERLFGVRLSIRAFLRFLSSHVVSTSTIACESLPVAAF